MQIVTKHGSDLKVGTFIQLYDYLGIILSVDSRMAKIYWLNWTGISGHTTEEMNYTLDAVHILGQV